MFDTLKEHQVRLQLAEKQGLDLDALQKFLVSFGRLVDLNTNGLADTGTLIVTFAEKSAACKLIAQRMTKRSNSRSDELRDGEREKGGDEGVPGGPGGAGQELGQRERLSPSLC